MEIAIGLPNSVAGTTGEQLIEFARRADQRGFSSLGTIDRLVYDSYEPLVALAAVAAVTDRIRLLTSMLLAPLRRNNALLAKQAAGVQALSGGRLTLGLAPGGREDDYHASGLAMERRGARMDETIEDLRRIWAGEELGTAGAIGPRVDPPPRIIIGGSAAGSFRRAARYGEAWMMGGGTPDQLAEGAEQVRKEWNEAGRDGEPRVMALVYFALGPDGQREADEDLKHYYEWLGEETANLVASSAATDPDAVRAYLSAFEQAGCDELVWFSAASNPEQVDLLADAVGM
jgi:alkanesulfonate monooxygenase SsuD/methylene tetrahydromethanopterin reductase-like flavin-dependent oxidoreductase (luciferase family)